MSNDQGQATDSDTGEFLMIGGIRIDVLGTQADFLRNLYNNGADAILEEARQMLAKGQGQEKVARWVVEQRNALKLEIRLKGPDLFRKIAEMRNKLKYGNPMGPDYPHLKAKGLSNRRIIDGVKNTSKGFNAAGGRLRIVGRTAGALGFVFQAMEPSAYELEPLPKSKSEEVEIEKARLRYGIPATANIDKHGHLKPSFYLQLGTFDPHGEDEFFAETEEIAWFLGVTLTYRYRGTKWTVPGREWTTSSPTSKKRLGVYPPPGSPGRMY